MIHGGPRYLLKHPSVTRSSCEDSGYIQRIAPHLLFRIPFLFPVPGRGLRARATLLAVDAFFEFYDRYQPLKRGKRHAVLSAAELRVVEPGLVGDYAGAVTFDEWGIDGARLCVLNALDAREHGASIFTHHEVEAFHFDGAGNERRVRGVAARDRLTGAYVSASAPLVVNATGAWSPVTGALLPGVSIRMRPGKGIHVIYDRRLSNYAITAEAVDGRQVFLMPWQNLSFIGTTDDDYYGDLDVLRSSTDEVRYLIDAIARVFPTAARARVIGTTVGVRPTLPRWGVYESDLSREHEILDHGLVDGVHGVFSMIGGKLASYRIFAEEMTDLVAKIAGCATPCRTHVALLPGGDAGPDAVSLAAEAGIAEVAASRLLYRHGSRASRVCAAGSTRVVCPCEPVLECEVRYACREEGARTLSDVGRRTRLGLGACGGLVCARPAARIVSEEVGGPPDAVQRMASELILERAQSRAPAIDGVQLAEEELLRAQLFAAGVGPPAEHG
jgi:glycerol-3-phosphate dehydrogenase